MKFSFLKISSLIFLLTLTFSCDQQAAFDSSPSATGIAGSYARFMIVGSFFYVIDDENIKTFSLADPVKPELLETQNIGERIESIFNIGRRLFIGSGSGMYIYNINDLGLPEKISEFSYEVFSVTPCDPVVATDSFAYVTLNTAVENRSCGGTGLISLNQLVIFDISKIEEPELIAEYPMTLPKGVGIDEKTLFVCDDKAGLKIFDVTNPRAIESLAHFNNFTAFDVIPLDGLLLVVGPENVYQFDYTDLSNIQLISTIPISA